MTDIELKINLPKEIYDEICRFDGKHDVLINRGILYDAIKDGILLYKIQVQNNTEGDVKLQKTGVNSPN